MSVTASHYETSSSVSKLRKSVNVSADAVALDGDNPKHVQWVFQESLERAAEFNITGFPYRLTQGKAA